MRVSLINLIFLLCQLALALSGAPRVVWNASIWPSAQRRFAVNGSTVVTSNSTAVEGRDVQTGVLKYSLSVQNFSYISDELILIHNGTTLYAHEVETGAYRYGNGFFWQINQAIVLGHYFLVWSNDRLWGCTTDFGPTWWIMRNVTDVTGLTYCGPHRVCVEREQGLMLVDMQKGKVVWGPNPELVFTTSRAFVPIGDSGGRLVVASGGYLSLRQIVLLDVDTGNVIWNVSLGPARSTTDLLANNNLVAVTYITLNEAHKNNAYPSTAVALNLTNGQPLFRYGPKGLTMGASRFLSNGNIVFIGDEALIEVSGKTGTTVCQLSDNVLDYGESAAPAVSGTRFFASYFLMKSSYTQQQLVALEC